MSPREQLVAYLATLGALVIVFIASVVGFGIWPADLTKAEVFGLGTITGGLIGILRLPASRSTTATTESGDVNVKDPGSAS